MAKELSIFIDESGDFGEYDSRSPYYIIGLVMHDQSEDISEPLKYLETGLKQVGFTRNCVHVGPLIRREQEYTHLSVEMRVRILRKMLNFVSKVDFSYKAFAVEKKHIEDEAELTAKLARQISSFISDHYRYFLSYDTVKIYYDNGQVGVTKIIISVFTALLPSTQIKRAMQKDYRMLQVADLVCTAELTELKMKSHTLSRSERHVLGTDRDINKNLLKPLKKKEFKNKK